MSATLTLLLAMQYVVSVKAGLVNHVQGTANVAAMDMARPGRPIRTAANGYVEVLLTPGSFLRLGENSEVTLDGVELDDVRVTVVRGPVVIEVIEINKNTPIQVTTGNLTTKVTQNGIYRFENGVATVLAGKLQTADSDLAYEKGWQVFFQDNYRARKTKTIQLTSLDVYSDARSQEISRANMTLASTLRSSNAADYWLYAPYIGWYTFIPRSNFRSPYGYRYYGMGSYIQPRATASSGSGGGGGGGSTGGTAPSPGTNNNNNTGGAPSSAPAVTVTTPAGEQTSPGVYIESKNKPTGASQ